jgi:hypothetical protein
LHGTKGGEGPFVSTPYQPSTRDRVELHGAKGGEGPFASSPEYTNVKPIKCLGALAALITRNWIRSSVFNSGNYTLKTIEEFVAQYEKLQKDSEKH